MGKLLQFSAKHKAILCFLVETGESTLADIRVCALDGGPTGPLQTLVRYGYVLRRKRNRYVARRMWRRFRSRRLKTTTAEGVGFVSVRCDYCGRQAVLVDSAEVYNGRSYGTIWLCRPCRAWVGVHKGDGKNVPLGRLANAELREAKKAAHAAFDPLWKKMMRVADIPKRRARGKAYRWLAGELEIDAEDCHIGMFDVEQCRRVVEVCEAATRHR